MKFRNILALNRKYSKQDGYGYILWKSDKTPSKLLHNIIQLSLVQTTIKWHEWTILESLIRVVWTWSCCMLVPQSSLCTSISRVLGDLLHSEHSQYFVNPITSPRFHCYSSASVLMSSVFRTWRTRYWQPICGLRRWVVSLSSVPITPPEYKESRYYDRDAGVRETGQSSP